MTHRILHVSDSFPGCSGEVGGAEVIAERVISLLETAGCCQGLVTAVTKKKLIKQCIPHYCLETLEEDLQEIEWLTAFKSQLFPHDPLIVSGFSAVLDEFNPDVVFFHSIRKISLAAVTVCSLKDIPTVVHIYDYIHFCPAGMFVDADGNLCNSPGDKCFECHPLQSKKLNGSSQKLLPLREKLFSPLSQMVDSFVVLSNASAKLLEKVGIPKESVEVIPQPQPETSYMNHDCSVIDGHILFIGWGQSRKGLLVVAKALCEVRGKFSFEAVGALVDPDYVSEVKNQLELAGLNPARCLKGRVDDAELHRSMERASVIVIAEQWENMSPAVLHEAMAAGKVVIAGAIGGIPEFITTGVDGFLVDYDNPKEFARQIDEVLSNSELTKRIGENAVARAQRNSNSVVILNKYLQLVCDLRDRVNNRLKNWLDNGPCVIICGGKGTRLGVDKKDTSKSLVKVSGVPVLRRIMDFWAPYVNEFILVLSQDTLDIEQYCKDIDYKTTCIVEKKTGQGVAGALLEARSYVQGKFIMVLGDCLYKGPINIPKGMDRGVGVFDTSDTQLIRNNFSVKITDNGNVSELEEKPECTDDCLCGMGVYFLDSSIWSAILQTSPDNKGIVQITSVLQTCVENAGLFPVEFGGGYININYPEDLMKAGDMWLDNPVYKIDMHGESECLSR